MMGSTGQICLARVKAHGSGAALRLQRPLNLRLPSNTQVVSVMTKGPRQLRFEHTESGAEDAPEDYNRGTKGRVYRL